MSFFFFSDIFHLYKIVKMEASDVGETEKQTSKKSREDLVIENEGIVKLKERLTKQFEKELENDINCNRLQVDTLKKEQSENKIQSLEKEVKELWEKLEAKTAEIKELRLDLLAKTAPNEALKNKYDQKIENLEKEVKNLREKSKSNTLMTLINRHNETTNNLKKKYENKIENLEKEVKDLGEKLQSSTAYVGNLIKSHNETKNNLKMKYENTIENLENVVKELNREAKGPSLATSRGCAKAALVQVCNATFLFFTPKKIVKY